MDILETFLRTSTTERPFQKTEKVQICDKVVIHKLFTMVIQSSEEEEEGDEESRSEFSVSVKDLMQAPRGNLHPVRRTRLEGITGTPDERCKDGLQCIRKVTPRLFLLLCSVLSLSVIWIFSVCLFVWTSFAFVSGFFVFFLALCILLPHFQFVTPTS